MLRIKCLKYANLNAVWFCCSFQSGISLTIPQIFHQDTYKEQKKKRIFALKYGQ